MAEGNPIIDMRFDPENGDALFPEHAGKTIHHATKIQFGGLPKGMQSGRTSVSIVIPLADGSVVIAESSLRLFLAAASALRARYGEE